MKIFSKSIIILSFLLALSIAPAEANSNNEAERVQVDRVIQTFVEALINGDISTIKSCIAGSLETSIKTLMNENRRYSHFLREHYANAQFQIDEPKIQGKRAYADIAIERRPNEKRFFKIKLEKNKNKKWLIIEQSEIF